MKSTNRNNNGQHHSKSLLSSSEIISSNKEPLKDISTLNKSKNLKNVSIFVLVGLIALFYFFYTPNSNREDSGHNSSLAALSESKSPTSTESPPSISNSSVLKDIVKIGLNLELSGDGAEFGIKEYNGAKLAIDQFNEPMDKPFTVEIVEADYGEDFYMATSLTEQLIEEEVIGIIGPDEFRGSLGSYELASLKGIPIISLDDPLIRNLLQSSGEPYEYVWNIFPQDNWQGKALALYAYNDLGLRKVALLDEDDEYGYYQIRVTETFVEEFKALGGEIEDSVQYNYMENDFRSHIEKIKDKNIDGVFIGGNDRDKMIQIVKDIQTENLNVPIMGTDFFFDRAEDSKLNNIYCASDFDYTTIDYSSPLLPSFEEAYKRKYGRDPSLFSYVGYDAANLLLSSLEQSYYSGDALNEQIKNSNFVGLMGSFNLDPETHTNEGTTFVIETLVNGTPQKVKEIKLK